MDGLGDWPSDEHPATTRTTPKIGGTKMRLTLLFSL
jgi:hypothetical protein